MNILSFSSLNLREALLNNVSSLGYANMTPVQSKSLPIILEGKDVIAQAKTGSGKTAAFGLATLNALSLESFTVQSLILCPTRELAEQVTQALRQLARMMPNVKVLNLSGGMPMRPQLDSLKHGAHIIVGTPGRIQKHLDLGSLLVNQLKILVLDEADRMLDMGFFDAISDVITLCPPQRQTLLFSATFPNEIKELASQFMQDPQKVVIEESNVELDIEQVFYEVSDSSKKLQVLKALLLHHQPTSTLIFCNTKQQTKQLISMLGDVGFSAIALNGDMEQVERDLAFIRFRNQSCSILVATDVAARGLDIKELPAVINYDLAFEYESHVHRIGRTGRAGSKGLALSITTPEDAQQLCMIEDNLRKPLVWGDASELNKASNTVFSSQMVTLCLNVGRKDKIRPGDILGALTQDAGLSGDMVGKIDITSLYSYVAIHHSQVDRVTNYLQKGKLKGRKVSLKSLL